MLTAGVHRPFLRLARLGLCGAILATLMAAGGTSALILRREAALSDVARADMAWIASQAALEVARLHGAVGAALVPGSGVDAAEVDRRLEKVEARLHLFDEGELAAYVASSLDLQATVERYRDMARTARAAVDGTGPDGLPALLRRVGDLQPEMARLAATANATATAEIAADQKQLRTLQRLLIALGVALALFGAALLASLLLHNRSLAAARREIERQNRALQAHDRDHRRQNARFDAALNNMAQALCMMDQEQRLIVCNVRFLELFGVTSRDTRPGTPAAEVFAAVAAAGRYGADLVETISVRQRQRLESGEAFTSIEEDADGRALAVSHEPLSDGGWVATFEDVSARRQTEARIMHLAHHDAMTGLPNRVLFHARLETALQRHTARGDAVAVLCLDLDQFKQVNDTFGHPAGDSLLQAVAARLLRCVREGDLVVRLGGDEFAILQLGARQPESAASLARRVVEEVGRAHEIEGHRVFVGTSIGIALAGIGMTDADTLLKSADIALYCAKADGRGAFRFFEPAMDMQMRARRSIEGDLRLALGRREFEVHYQPLFDVARNRISGFEALLRWRHPARGLIAPAVFIPIAEELGLIGGIGEWVLTRACAEAATWPGRLKLAINLSALQFRNPSFPGIVQRALAMSGFSAARLEVEITEGALLHDSQTVVGMLHELCDLGVRIVLDDFGTGYSSISYLRSFPFHRLKFDRSMIVDIAGRSDSAALVRSVAGLAHTLGMATTAEGVETADQLARLREMGCDEVQGFLFDPARPAGELGHWFPVPLMVVAAE